MKAYADLYQLPEDARIQVIGKAATVGITGIIVEKADLEKINRYIRKITTEFPEVTFLSKTDGPTKDTVLLKFGPK